VVDGLREIGVAPPDAERVSMLSSPTLAAMRARIPVVFILFLHFNREQPAFDQCGAGNAKARWPCSRTESKDCLHHSLGGPTPACAERGEQGRRVDRRPEDRAPLWSRCVARANREPRAFAAAKSVLNLQAQCVVGTAGRSPPLRLLRAPG